MAKKMLIDATHPEETRVVVVDGPKVEEFDFESLSTRQLAGNIYLAKVTRVEPSLQAAFVDYGGNRHGFLAFSEIHPDYYQSPIADREALLAEEREYAEAMAAEAEEEAKPKRRRTRRRKPNGTKAETTDADAVTRGTPSGMDVVDLDGPEDDDEDVSDTAEHLDAEAPGMEAEDAAGDAAAEDAADAGSDETGDEPEDGDVGDDGDDGDEAAPDAAPAAETVADDDTEEDIRPVRKPRARKYKIQEVVKVRQIMLVQVVKEERGNKGAALTTYLSLAGRYCVLMPNTARGGGISRKITNAADRKKLKEIATSLDVPQGAGLIIRTAGSQRTKTEIKRDYEYLQRQWEQVRELTLRSVAPALIYQEGDLIHRTIRDLYNRDIDEVLATVAGYGARHVTVTGGEPLAQADCLALLTALANKGYVVSLETSGALDIAAIDPRVIVVMDLKAPGSGEVERNRYDNIPLLKPEDQVKFVLGDEDDYRWSVEQLRRYELTRRCTVLFSPVSGKLEPTRLADWILRDRLHVRFQVQLHKLLWGDQPGR